MTYEELAQEWTWSESLLCHSSGSTGTPKEISIEKKHLIESARRTLDFFNLSDSALLYSCIAPDFIGGKMMFVRQQVAECDLIWETPSNRPVLETDGRRISLLSLVPSQMHHILDHIHELPPIDNILIGGSAIPSALRERIDRSGLNVYESYGMTETASHIALRKVEENPNPFVTLGDITVSLSGETLKITIPGWQTLTTNDCAQVLSPHEFMILGRKDNVIISGGRKLNPERIEEKLSRHIDFPFYITSVPDDKWGERLVLIAENTVTDSDTLKATITEAFDLLEKYEKPKEIHICQSLKRTNSGKLLRLPPSQIEL